MYTVQLLAWCNYLILSWPGFRYSACVLCSDTYSVCDLTLASGTVFNKILLWHLSSDQTGKRTEPDHRVKVSLTLSGHEAREKLAIENNIIFALLSMPAHTWPILGCDFLHQVQWWQISNCVGIRWPHYSCMELTTWLGIIGKVQAHSYFEQIFSNSSF